MDPVSSHHQPNVMSTRLAMMLASLVAIGPFGIDTYLPALPTMASFYQASVASVQMSISLFLIGFALGQVVGGPISDRVGRKPVALVGLGVFTVSSAMIMFTIHIDQLLELRFIQALGGGCTAVISGATIRDRYAGKDVAKMLSLVSAIMLMAPMLAPAIGALMLALAGWKSIFALLAVYSAVLFVMVIVLLPETNPQPKKEGSLLRQVGKNYGEVLTHGKAMGYVLCTGFSVGGLFTFLTGSSFTYIEYFGVSASVYPILFGSSVFVYMMVNRLNMRLLNRYQPEQLIPLGVAIQLVAMVILNTHTIFFEPSLPVVYAMVTLTISSIGFIAANSTSCTLRYFPHSSGTANAVIGTLNFGMGGVTGFLMSLVHDGTLLPMTLTMLIVNLCSLLAFLRGQKATEPEVAEPEVDPVVAVKSERKTKEIADHA